MKSLILMLVLISPNCFAESVNDLILNLNNDDFEVREQAQEELSNYPKDYAFIFRSLSESFKNEPEIAVRLFEASRAIFFQKVVPDDFRWRRFIAYSGMETRGVSAWLTRQDSEQKEYTLVFSAQYVYWVDDEGPAATIVKEGDYIISPYNQDAEFGKDSELILRTYKNAQDVEENETYDTSPHEDRIVKITYGRISDKRIDWKDGSRLVLRIWDDFEIAYNDYFIKGLKIP